MGIYPENEIKLQKIWLFFSFDVWRRLQYPELGHRNKLLFPFKDMTDSKSAEVKLWDFSGNIYTGTSVTFNPGACSLQKRLDLTRPGSTTQTRPWWWQFFPLCVRLRKGRKIPSLYLMLKCCIHLLFTFYNKIPWIIFSLQILRHGWFKSSKHKCSIKC